MNYCSYGRLCHNIISYFDIWQTYTGNILIAVNPFKRLPHLYDAKMMERYKGVALGELDPHVFAIADVAFRLFPSLFCIIHGDLINLYGNGSNW